MKQSKLQQLSASRNGLKWLLKGIYGNLSCTFRSPKRWRHEEPVMSEEEILAIKKAAEIIKDVLDNWQKDFISSNYK